MKDWIENRIRIMKQNKDPKIIVFPIVRRANEVEEYREKKRKMSGNSPHISLHAISESDSVYKVRFSRFEKHIFGDNDGNPPKRA